MVNQEYINTVEQYLAWDNINTQFNKAPQTPGLRQQISAGIFENPNLLNDAPLDAVAFYAESKKSDSLNDMSSKTQEDINNIVNNLTNGMNLEQSAFGLVLPMPYFESELYKQLTEKHKGIHESQEVIKNKDIQTATSDLVQKFGVEQAILYHASIHKESVFDIYQAVIQARVRELTYELTNKESGELKETELKNYIKYLTTNDNEESKNEALKHLALTSYQLYRQKQNE